MGPDIESFREILVNDIIGLQKQEFSPRFKIIIIFIKMAQNSSYLKSTQLIKINSKLFVEKKPFLFDVLFIAGMFAKTSFLIYLIVLIAVASSFVSVALTWKISISQLCCCCLRIVVLLARNEFSLPIDKNYSYDYCYYTNWNDVQAYIIVHTR